MQEIDAEFGHSRQLREKDSLPKQLLYVCLMVVMAAFALTIGYLPIAGFVYSLCRDDGISRSKSLTMGVAWPVMVPVSFHANFPDGGEPSFITRLGERFLGRVLDDK